jgi:hypothetical protein
MRISREKLFNIPWAVSDFSKTPNQNFPEAKTLGTLNFSPVKRLYKYPKNNGFLLPGSQLLS